MSTKIIIRGWKRGVLQFTEHIEVRENAFDEEDFTAIATRHALSLREDGHLPPHMIEIEFVDEPDPLQRYARFGTDPAMMVNPVRTDDEFFTGT